MAAVKFRLGAIKLVEKLIFDVTYEKIGVARSHFGTHSDAVDLFVVWLWASEKQFSVKTGSTKRSSVSELGSLIVSWSKKNLSA